MVALTTEVASLVASSDDVVSEPKKKQANRGQGEDDAVAAAQAQGPAGSSAASRNLSSLPRRAIAGLGGPTCAAGSQAWGGEEADQNKCRTKKCPRFVLLSCRR